MQFSVAAVREEEFGAADGAERERVDAFRHDAGLDELFAVRTLQVNERAPFARRREKRVGVSELRAEGFDDFLADLVATRKRRRADCRVTGGCRSQVSNSPAKSYRAASVTKGERVDVPL